MGWGLGLCLREDFFGFWDDQVQKSTSENPLDQDPTGNCSTETGARVVQVTMTTPKGVPIYDGLSMEKLWTKTMEIW
jgi:hypothetical protein